MKRLRIKHTEMPTYQARMISSHAGILYRRNQPFSRMMLMVKNSGE